jgi:putative transposase
MKDLETKNARLKLVDANLTLETDAVKDVLQKKYGGLTIKEKR